MNMSTFVALRRLQRSWKYRPVANGCELFSEVARRRFVLKGDPKQLIQLMDILVDGLACGSEGPSSDTDGFSPVDLDADSIAKYLGVLQAKGITVQTAGSTIKDGLYARQISFLDFFETETVSGQDLNTALRDSSVLVLGLGGYGCWVTPALARVGIGRIIGIDSDVVEESNLPRQILYDRTQLGLKKTTAWLESMQKHIVDQDVKCFAHDQWISRPEDLTPLLESVDLVICPFGYFPNSTLWSAVTACGSMGVPLLILGTSWIGPLTVPGVTGCYACVLSNDLLEGVIARSAGTWTVDNQRSLRTGSPERSWGAFAPRLQVHNGVAVWEAVRFLAGLDRATTLDNVVAVDLFGYQNQTLPVQRREDCPTCGSWRSQGWRADSAALK